MTAADTFPTDATDQQVQQNVVAAHYDVPALIVAPASAVEKAPGLQTFAPESAQDIAVSFTNTTGAPVHGLKLSVAATKQWKAVAQDGGKESKTFNEDVAPGATVSATFRVTSSSRAFNGDLVAKASWKGANGKSQSETAVEKLRNASAVKINEVRIGSGSGNHTDSFIELFNAGESAVDVSNWTVTERPTQQAMFSTVKIPAGTQVAAHGFYLLGLANSGLVAGAHGFGFVGLEPKSLELGEGLFSDI